MPVDPHPRLGLSWVRAWGLGLRWGGGVGQVHQLRTDMNLPIFMVNLTIAL
jgi:hypothetical protein